jgi:hypothetical protein
MSDVDDEIAAIKEACKPGPKQIWNPSFDTTITRQADGSVEMWVSSGNRAVFLQLRSVVCDMVTNNEIEGLKSGSARFSFTCKPVR